MIKRMIIAALLLASLTSLAHADGYVEETPGEGDLTKAEAQATAEAFFAEKCGLEEFILHNADWTIQFGHSTLDTAEDSAWTIAIEHIDAEGHERIHVLRMTGPGKLIEWSAHGQTYQQANPGLLDTATPAGILPGSIQADAVTTLVREAMIERGFVLADAAAALTITPHFVFDEQFDMGKIPVWMVLIEDGQGGAWKAAVTYKGELLSLGLFEQLYQASSTPGEHFWDATFSGESWVTEWDLLNGVIECTLSIEERAEVTARWRPLVEAWMAEHPYYMNLPGVEYAVCIQNIYGVPDEQAIPQEQAEQLAAQALEDHLGSEEYVSGRTLRTNYFVTDPAQPVWSIRFSRPKNLPREMYRQNPEVMKLYIVTINARTGDVRGIEGTETIY